MRSNRSYFGFYQWSGSYSVCVFFLVSFILKLEFWFIPVPLFFLFFYFRGEEIKLILSKDNTARKIIIVVTFFVASSTIFSDFLGVIAMFFSGIYMGIKFVSLHKNLIGDM